MKPSEPEDEFPIAWNAIEQHEDVFASDGEQVGAVEEVLGGDPTGIFHGIVLRTGVLDRPIMAPADAVETITNRRITLNVDSEAVRSLPVYVEEDSFKLGWVGLFHKVVG